MRRSLFLSAVAALAALPLLPGCSGDRIAATPPGQPAAAVSAPEAGTRAAAPAEAAQSPAAEAVPSGNTPPEIRAVRFLPGDARNNGTLSLEAESFDADGDAVQVRTEWTVNGKPAGTGSRPEVPVRRGDKITVSLTPFDGKESGRTAALTREIRNTPPVITGHERFQVEDGVVSFQVAASDADGDALKYSLKEAPPGMRIDPAGRIHWEMPPEAGGKIPLTVAVADGAGGETSARINITIRAEGAAQQQK